MTITKEQWEDASLVERARLLRAAKGGNVTGEELNYLQLRFWEDIINKIIKGGEQHD